MKALTVELVALGLGATHWLPLLADGVSRALACRCLLHPQVLDAGFALMPARSQFYSGSILAHLEQDFSSPLGHVILGVTENDLGSPIFTFVFGEAIDGGSCALVSGHRLRQEFYGLPPDPALFAERLLKTAVHELGHTRGLRHCAGHRCVMATSYSIERVDLKGLAFCPSCKAEWDAGARE